jgi:hypothetical protein
MTLYLYMDHGSHWRGDVIHARCWSGSHINEPLRAYTARLPKFPAKNFPYYCDGACLLASQCSKWPNKFSKQWFQTKFQNMRYIPQKIVKIGRIS